jgi:ribosome recycling factor
MDALKKLKGSISEDDTRRFSKEVETLTEKKLEKIVKLLKDKEKDIMDV